MVRGNVGDFAPNLRRARQLVTEPGASRGALLGAIAKPAFWSDHESALKVSTILVTDLHASDRSVIADLVYVCVLGICRTLIPDTEAIDIASTLLAQAMITVGDDFGDIPTLPSAARTAPTNSERSLPDLLPRAAAKILRIYEMTLSSAHAATQLQTLTGRCSDTDTVRRVILRLH